MFVNVPDDLKSTIKSFYVFESSFNESSLFVTIDDKVFGIGWNNDGVCGQGHDKWIKDPLIIIELNGQNVKEFFNGLDFVLCLTSDNKLFSWGKNDHGQLGIGCVIKYRNYEPQLIQYFGDKKIVQVCCGERHSLVLTEEGVVYGWGDNWFGQTGVGLRSYKMISSPIQWNIENKIIKIHCSEYQSFAITESGKVYCCGWNDHCQLGSQLRKDEYVFSPRLHDINWKVESVITSRTNTYFVTFNGDIYFCGEQQENGNYGKIPSFILNFREAKCVTSSNYELNCLKYGIVYCENSIYEFKYNKFKKTKYKTFERYFYDRMFKMTYKTIYFNHDITSNLNSYRIITKSYIPRHLQEVKVIDKFKICDHFNIKHIIRYFYVFNFGKSVLFVTIDDIVFGFGTNFNGVLGLGHQNEVETLEIILGLCDKSVENFFIGNNFVLCSTSDNCLFSWGRNEHAQLGIGQVNDYRIFKPQLIEYFNTKVIIQISCGQYHSSVLTSDGNVHLWGYYDNEKHFEIPIVCEFVEDIKLIHCTERLTFCLTQNGSVFYWEKDTRLMPIAINSNIQSICSSNYDTYLISIISAIYIILKNEFSEIETKFIIKISNFGHNFQTISILDSNAVLYNDNSVYELKDNECWKTKYSNPFDYFCDRYEVTFKTIELSKVLENEEDIIARNTTNDFIKNFIIQEKNLSDILKPFPLTNKIGTLKLFISYFYVIRNYFGHNILFITNDDKVYGFGNNANGCCGLGHDNSVNEPQLIIELCNKNVISFFNGENFVMALSINNVIYAWGKVGKEYLKPKIIYNFESKIVEICYLDEHFLILSEEGIVYGWGDNSSGQIESSNTKYISIPLMLDELPKIKLIACCYKRSFAVSEENQIFVWGDTNCGKLVIQIVNII